MGPPGAPTAPEALVEEKDPRGQDFTSQHTMRRWFASNLKPASNGEVADWLHSNPLVGSWRGVLGLMESPARDDDGMAGADGLRCGTQSTVDDEERRPQGLRSKGGGAEDGGGGDMAERITN